MRNRAAALIVVAVVAANVVPLVGASVALAGTDDGTPGIVVQSPTPAGFTGYGAVRFKAVGTNAQGDEYLGVADLGVGTNRIESTFDTNTFSLNGNVGSRSGDCQGAYIIGAVGSPASNVVIFTWDKVRDTLTTVFVTPTLNCTMVFGPGFAQELANARGVSPTDAQALLESVNALQVFIDDRQAGSTINFTNVSVDGPFAIGPFIGVPGGQKSWLGTGYDFDAPKGFTVAGSLRLAGSFGSCDETCKLEIQFGNLGPADDEGPITANVVVTPDPVAVGASATMTANVDDTATGGSDIASAEFDLDQGASWAPMAASDGLFDEVSEDVTSGFTAPGEPGVYELCVRGTDGIPNTGPEECTRLIVVDPAAGFVTGGGWIDSPEGAYKANPQLGGRANFGFVSKYGKGTSVPDGSIEFRFKAGVLNFHGNVQEWLIVNERDSRARFQGTGTINGGGTYGFTIWATDGSPDTVRMKIWDRDDGDAVVYDNGTDASNADTAYATGQPLSGGSIVVHTW